MKILLVLGRYLPEKSGGIENYTHFLAKLLTQNGHEVEVAILNSDSSRPYIYDEIRVIPLIKGFESFSILLGNREYNVCHFQELSGDGGINLSWMEEAKKYCDKLFFTFHLPYLTCYKNDFRFRGIEDCNYFTSTERCVECIIATKLHYQKDGTLNWYNSLIRKTVAIFKNTPQIKRIRKRINVKHDQLARLIELCDSIFIYGTWFKKLLNENGYDSFKLKLIPHISKANLIRKIKDDSIKNRLLFVGRIEEAKGLHLLVAAMREIKIGSIQLHVAGNKVDEKYFDKCKKLFDFNYLGVLPRNELLQSFPGYDFLVLPSAFTEMSSLVLKEAFYENLPVIVSSAKGNVDVVHEDMDGFIFNYNDFKDLVQVIDKAYDKKMAGWVPDFSGSPNTLGTDQEILSYYHE